jgi:hypothetical protein
VTITRRRFLVTAVAAPLVGVAGCAREPEPAPTPAAACVDQPADARADAADRPRPEFDSEVEAYAWELAGVALLGTALVEKGLADQALVETDRDQLRATLEARLDGSSPAEGVPGLIRTDFETGAVVRVEGWIISETEARLAVLHRLLAGPAAPAPVAEQPDFENATVCQFLDLDRWGPQKTTAGEGFNVQRDGHFGNWFIFRDTVPDGLRIYLDGTALRTTRKDNVATTAIYDPLASRMIMAPGEHEFWAYDVTRNRKQRLGAFRVEGRPQTARLENGELAAALCPVVNWGPGSTAAGEVFNPQPDGNGALWFRTACSPRQLQVFLGDTPLEVTRRPSDNLVTAKLLDPGLLDSPGSLPVRFVDAGTGESIEVGRFLIR